MSDSKNTLTKIPCLKETLFNTRGYRDMNNLPDFTWKKYYPAQLEIIKRAEPCSDADCPYIHGLAFETAVCRLILNKQILPNDEYVDLCKNVYGYDYDSSDEDDDDDEDYYTKYVYKYNVQKPHVINAEN